MVAKYQLGCNYTQNYICSQVMGSVVNLGASDGQVTTALNVCSNYTRNAYYNHSVLSFAYIKGQIQKNCPMIFGITWTNSTNGHFVVCSGYQDSPTKVYIVDPAVGCSAKWFNYQDAVNRTQYQSGHGAYNRTWYYK